MRESKFRENLFNELKETKEYRNFSDRELNYKVFKHPAGNRLTFDGLTILTKIYDSYDFNIHSGNLSTRQLISLSREMKFPYYIAKSRLVLFNGEDAFLLKIYCDNVAEWLDNAAESHSPQ